MIAVKLTMTSVAASRPEVLTAIMPTLCDAMAWRTRQAGQFARRIGQSSLTVDAEMEVRPVTRRALRRAEGMAA